MRKHPARRTRVGIAVTAALSTVGLTAAYAVGSAGSAGGTSTAGGGATANTNSLSNTSSYDDRGYYDDNGSSSTVVSPSQNVPDTSSSAS
jgi:hypothetical protein